MLLAILILAINYQNNLIFALCFWLMSIFVVTIFHSYANLAGMRLRVGRCEPVFSGQDAIFHLNVSAAGRVRHQLDVGFQEQPPQQLTLVDRGEVSEEVKLHWVSQRRGWSYPGRVRLRSYFPLGIIRCWCLPALSWQCLVYPQPKMLRPLPLSFDTDDSAANSIGGESEDISALKSYQRGDSPRRIHWKAYAKEQGLLTKHYDQARSDTVVLDWFSLAGLDAESRLSTLCAWVLACDEALVDYGLRLPNSVFPAAQGASHLATLLRALALYEHRGE